MFDMTLPMKPKNMKHQVRNESGLLVRTSFVALCTEFSKAVATGIDSDAQRLQQLLCDRALSSASIPMSALKELRVSIGDGDGGLELDAYGVELNLVEPKAESGSPGATFLIGFATEDEPVLWLLHHLEEVLEVKITKKQLELAGTSEATPPKKRGRKATAELPGTDA
jgi:hypothetical protein